jgi:hypothetical protein
MQIEDLLVNSIDPVFHILDSRGVSDSEEAYILSIAIGYQESGFMHRRQIGGPARGYWQFEKGGGVWNVLNAAAAKPHMLELCKIYDVPANATDVFEALAWHDSLAAGAARLNLWCDPHKLPAVGDIQTAWDYYIRVWRPGAPHRDAWNSNYAKAVAAIN